MTTTQSNFTPIKKGAIIINEKPQPVRCGYCPALIFKENEVGGRLRKVDGFVACVKCRIMKSKSGTLIAKDKEKYEADVKEKETRAQEAEDQGVRVVAYESQIATNTAISKKDN